MDLRETLSELAEKGANADLLREMIHEMYKRRNEIERLFRRLGPSAHLLSLRQTRRDVLGVHSFRLDCGGSQFVLTRPGSTNF